MRVELFDFELPEELIALRPARPRDSARLLLVPAEGAFEDRVVREAPGLFRPDDLLVFNDTRVIAARLKGQRARGDHVTPMEVTLARRVGEVRWEALAKPGKRLREGDTIHFEGPHSPPFHAVVAEKKEDGFVILDFPIHPDDLARAIDSAGVMPLPPYIAGRREEDEQDRDDYQTVFAAKDGAVAAPTAGLHFTEALLASFAARGVESTRVTLHVGAGTFLPVKAEDTAAHVMHSEWRDIPQATADAINRAKADGRRVIAIGTTALRSLESSVDESGRVGAISGGTDIFITPGYRFRVVDGLWTNFHLPRSTLFMLVSAFAGLERMQAAYAHAIADGYRFYSYGDASLLWRAQ